MHAPLPVELLQPPLAAQDLIIDALKLLCGLKGCLLGCCCCHRRQVSIPAVLLSLSVQQLELGLEAFHLGRVLAPRLLNLLEQRFAGTPYQLLLLGCIATCCCAGLADRCSNVLIVNSLI